MGNTDILWTLVVLLAISQTITGLVLADRQQQLVATEAREQALKEERDEMNRTTYAVKYGEIEAEEAYAFIRPGGGFSNLNTQGVQMPPTANGCYWVPTNEQGETTLAAKVGIGAAVERIANESNVGVISLHYSGQFRTPDGRWGRRLALRESDDIFVW